MNRIKEVLANKGIKQIWLAEKLGKSGVRHHFFGNFSASPSGIVFRVNLVGKKQSHSIIQTFQKSAVENVILLVVANQ